MDRKHRWYQLSLLTMFAGISLICCAVFLIPKGIDHLNGWPKRVSGIGIINKSGVPFKRVQLADSDGRILVDSFDEKLKSVPHNVGFGKDWKADEHPLIERRLQVILTDSEDNRRRLVFYVISYLEQEDELNVVVQANNVVISYGKSTP